jgi:capsular polysaccharide biosynthesis protein
MPQSDESTTMHSLESHYLYALARGWKQVLLFALITAIAGAGLSFLFPLQYSSTMRMLIIQKQLSDTDPYTAIKASERISDNLGQIIYTTSFFNKVMGAKFNIDQTVFKQDESKKRKQWHDMIATRVVQNSGMLVVTVYHVDPKQAEQISRAVAFVLTTDGWQYIGGGDLDVKLVDDPLVSSYPVRPNIPANAFMGLILGIIAGTGYVLSNARKHSLFGVPQ